ncbi:MAG: response regulator [archaeon]
MKKILVIEDEPHISKLVRVILEKNGFAVLQAFVGIEGIEIARKEKPGLIILDVMMPKMDGFEVCRLLAAGETKDIPVIMLSSAAQFRDRMRGIDAGAVEYITKPFDKNELILKVREHLR